MGRPLSLFSNGFFTSADSVDRLHRKRVINMSDKFDDFLERLESPFPEPKMKPVLDTLIGTQTAYTALVVCCARFAVHFVCESSASSCR